VAGLIRKSDIDEVKQRANIADIVGQYVTLKRGGADSLKGLCPFHNENHQASVSDRMLECTSALGAARAVTSTSFATDRHDDLLGSRRKGCSNHQLFSNVRRWQSRARILATGLGLLEANLRCRTVFGVEQLSTPEAGFGRGLPDRTRFRTAPRANCLSVGYAPNSFDALRKYLTAKKFTEVELETAGLLSRGERGVYDRFRGRLVWPDS